MVLMAVCSREQASPLGTREEEEGGAPGREGEEIRFCSRRRSSRFVQEFDDGWMSCENVCAAADSNKKLNREQEQKKRRTS